MFHNKYGFTADFVNADFVNASFIVRILTLFRKVAKARAHRVHRECRWCERKIKLKHFERNRIAISINFPYEIEFMEVISKIISRGS